MLVHNYESTLTDTQKEIMKNFLKNKSRPDIYIEEDVSGMRDYHFEITPTGLGDSVYVVCQGEKCSLFDEEML